MIKIKKRRTGDRESKKRKGIKKMTIVKDGNGRHYHKRVIIKSIKSESGVPERPNQGPSAGCRRCQVEVMLATPGACLRGRRG